MRLPRRGTIPDGGVVNVREAPRSRVAYGRAGARSGRRSGTTWRADDGAPGGAALVAGLAVDGGGAAVAARAAVRGDRAGGGEGARRMARRFEPSHAPLPLAGGLVRMLGPIIEPLVPALSTWDSGGAAGCLCDTRRMKEMRTPDGIVR